MWAKAGTPSRLLEAGVATWQDFLWSLDATAHVDPSCLAWALRKMEEAWPEEHLAQCVDRAVGAQCGPGLPDAHFLDGHGCQYRQTFVDAAGQTHWDHIFVTQLFSNASHRPAWDFVMAAEYCAVARIRQMLAEVPVRYLKFLKTDCLGLQNLPKKYWPAVERLTRLRHPDGTPVYRCEQVRGHHFEPEIQAWRGPLPAGAQPAAHRAARHREDAPCEAHRGAAVVQLVSKTHCAAQNLGLGAQTADHWVRRTVRNGRCQLDWLVVEEVTQMDTGLWADVACVALDRGVRFLLMGDFPRCWTASPGPAWNGRWRRAICCGTSRAATATSSRRTAARTSASSSSSAGSGLGKPRRCRWPRRCGWRGAPRPAGQHPDVCLVLSHAHRVQINERENRRLAPADAVLIEHQAPGAHEDDASLARAAAGGCRRQGGQGHLRAGGRGGRGARHAGRRAAVRPRGAAAAHAALPRHYLRQLPGADAPRPRVAAGRGRAALQPAAPVRRRQPGHQLRAAERALRGLCQIQRNCGAGPQMTARPSGPSSPSSLSSSSSPPGAVETRLDKLDGLDALDGWGLCFRMGLSNGGAGPQTTARSSGPSRPSSPSSPSSSSSPPPAFWLGRNAA